VRGRRRLPLRRAPLRALYKPLPERFGGFLGARQLAAKGDRAAVADAEGRLYVSEDADRAWTVAAEGLPSVRAVVIE
jgi:hypothetical protein